MTQAITIRKAEMRDAPALLTLIRELAHYEKAPEEVTNTVEAIERDGFGTNPAFECLLAEVDGEVAGISLWYIRYSTWKGKMLYLEDIIVTERHRGKGIGKLLLAETRKIAEDAGMAGMTWQVLDWNEPAIAFYKQYPVTLDEEWINVKWMF